MPSADMGKAFGHSGSDSPRKWPFFAMANEIEHKIRMNEGLIEEELLMPKEEQKEDDGEAPKLSLGA